METKISEHQKKQLEKVYNKIFEQGDPPTLTEEGKLMCFEANIKQEDLLVRQPDSFKRKNDVQEVANIRYEHYRQKRYRKYPLASNALFRKTKPNRTDYPQTKPPEKNVSRERRQVLRHQRGGRDQQVCIQQVQPGSIHKQKCEEGH